MVSVKERNEAVEYLKRFISPNDTVYTLVTHVAPSGMSRVIRTLIVHDGRIRDVSYMVAQALEWRYNDKHKGITVSGAGMDAGFHTVYTLARVLFQEETPEGYEAGYLLQQSWL